MACYYPLGAYRNGSGGVCVVKRGDPAATFGLACGQCFGCRIERARQWSVRVVHEAALWPENSFVTLTYDDEHCRSDRSLVYADFQRFMKRLRKFYAEREIRFFACGEYGDRFERPHFHACLFNVGFLQDRYYWRKSPAGFKLYRSPTLESLWKFGSSELGSVSRQSADYCARYSLKKVNGDLADKHYESIDESTGEVTWRAPECLHMSLKPGIGAKWFQEFGADVFPHDRVVVDGVVSKPPRYYDQLLRRKDRGLLEDLKTVRQEKARLRWRDNTPERLVVREVVAKARKSFSKRSIE